MRPLAAPEAIRQSDVATFDSCPLQLRFKWESEQTQSPGQMGQLSARGVLFHRFAAEAVNHMRRHGERQIDPDMALELLTEVIAQRDVPEEDVCHLRMSELRWLRVLVVKWSYQHTFTIERVVDVEKRLTAPLNVVGPNGTRYVRQITGRPDVLLAGPEPDEASVVDWKSGFAPPSKQREPVEGEPAREDKLSDMGYVQQTVYGWLVMKKYPAIERVTMREFYVMHDSVRQATVWRYEMERIEDTMAAVVAQIDAAIEAGPDSRRWMPVAGTHCGFCPRPHDCPIREEVGIPTNEEEAAAITREWIVAAVQRKQRAPLLKGWVDAHGPLEIDHAKGKEMVVGWFPNKSGGGRSFTLGEREEDVHPVDPLLETAAREAGVLAE